jgi:hypothetical protein
MRWLSRTGRFEPAWRRPYLRGLQVMALAIGHLV